MESFDYHFIEELLEDRNWKVGVTFSKSAREPEYFVKARTYIEKQQFGSIPELKNMATFFKSYNGLTVFEYTDQGRVHSVLRFVTDKNFHAVNRKYKSGGNWNAFFKIGKAKEIYEDEGAWAVVAEIDNGPKCLITFLTGVNTGSVFFFEPQPHFNITKPIAKSIEDFMSKLSKKTIETLNKFNSTITITKSDGNSYGYRIFNIIRE